MKMIHSLPTSALLLRKMWVKIPLILWVLIEKSTMDRPDLAVKPLILELYP